MAPTAYPDAQPMPACISIDHGHLIFLQDHPRWVAVLGPGGAQLPQWSVRYCGHALRVDEEGIRSLLRDRFPDAADAPQEYVRARLVSRYLRDDEALHVLADRPSGHVDPGVDLAFEEIPRDQIPRFDLQTCAI